MAFRNLLARKLSSCCRDERRASQNWLQSAVLSAKAVHLGKVRLSIMKSVVEKIIQNLVEKCFCTFQATGESFCSPFART